MTGAPWVTVEQVAAELPCEIEAALQRAIMRAGSRRLPVVEIGGAVVIRRADFVDYYGELPLSASYQPAVAPGVTMIRPPCSESTLRAEAS